MVAAAAFFRPIYKHGAAIRTRSTTSSTTKQRWTYSTTNKKNNPTTKDQNFSKNGGDGRGSLLLQNYLSSEQQQQRLTVGSRHFYSTSQILLLEQQQQEQYRPIRILYASQTGTAQLFAHQLEGCLEEEFPDMTVTVQAWHEQSPNEVLATNDIAHCDTDTDTSNETKEDDKDNYNNIPIHVFLCSVTGVGEPPDNGREFYNYIMDAATVPTTSNPTAAGGGIKNRVEYTVFGLGNQKAHPNHYNVIAKALDQRLEELGATRIHPLGLGDDGDCIEDDFDTWTEELLKTLKNKKKQSDAANDIPDTVSSPPASSTSASTAVSSEGNSGMEDSPAATETHISSTEKVFSSPTNVERDDISSRPRILCPEGVAKASDGTRLISKKYPPLVLSKPETDIVREDLFHLQGTESQFYHDNTAKLHVISNTILAPNGGEQALNEMRLALRDYANNHERRRQTFLTGDHLVVYPRNSQCIVDAYMNVLDVNPHAVIEDCDNSTTDRSGSSRGGSGPAYPFPKGLTVSETFSHCIDLGALPSPALSRLILGRKELDYKNEIANPRRTVLDLLLESSLSGRKLSAQQHDTNIGHIALEDFLYQMVPMKPRYYSIASSNIATPDEIRLTMRPVKYMTTRGVMREGVSTSYLLRKGAVGGTTYSADSVANGNEDTTTINNNYAYVAAYVNPNPTFRLPQDPKAPIMMIAGGCGVAPIRAFIDERIALQSANNSNSSSSSSSSSVNSSGTYYGPGTLYLGFRNPNDSVYKDLIDEALSCGALTDAKICFDHGVVKETENLRQMRVSELLRSQGVKVWEHLEEGGYTFLCGGARTFGAAIERELIDIIQAHGNLDLNESTAYLRKLIETGRLTEDLAD